MSRMPNLSIPPTPHGWRHNPNGPWNPPPPIALQACWAECRPPLVIPYFRPGEIPFVIPRLQGNPAAYLEKSDKFNPRKSRHPAPANMVLLNSTTQRLARLHLPTITLQLPTTQLLAILHLPTTQLLTLLQLPTTQLLTLLQTSTLLQLPTKLHLSRQLQLPSSLLLLHFTCRLPTTRLLSLSTLRPPTWHQSWHSPTTTPTLPSSRTLRLTILTLQPTSPTLHQPSPTLQPNQSHPAPNQSYPAPNQS